MLASLHFIRILTSLYALCVCEEVFLWSNVKKIFKKNLDKFVLKIWNSRRMSNFVGILNGVKDILLLDYP